MRELQSNELNRCIVLSPESHRDTAQSVVEKHELNAIIMHHPALAMAELALIYQELNSQRAWKDSQQTLQLIIVQSDAIPDVDKLIASISKYFHNIQLFELREGTLAPIQNHGSIVDLLEEPPIVQSQAIDAEELSMLLDRPSSEVEET